MQKPNDYSSAFLSIDGHYLVVQLSQCLLSDFLRKNLPGSWQDESHVACVIEEIIIIYKSKSTTPGLHQIKGSFPPHFGVEILLLMLCQLTSVFRGKVIMFGPNPVQQHLYPPILDLRDGQVRLYNALLRKRIVQDRQGSLLGTCRPVQIPRDTLIVIREPVHMILACDYQYLRLRDCRLVSLSQFAPVIYVRRN